MISSGLLFLSTYKPFEFNFSLQPKMLVSKVLQGREIRIHAPHSMSVETQPNFYIVVKTINENENAIPHFALVTKSLHKQSSQNVNK